MAVADLFRREQQRLILWVPVLFAIGALGYFAPNTEPKMTAGALSVFFMLLLCRHCWHRYRRFFMPACALTLVAIGFAWTQAHTQFTHTQMLEKEVKFLPLKGRIAALEVVPDGLRLTMDELSTEKNVTLPKRVRLKLRGEHPDLLSGQYVSLRGGLMPPSGPAAPGVFDFSRWFYFKGIGAVGYAIPPVEILQTQERSGVRLTSIREALSARIRAQLPQAEGAVAAALMTGDRAAIPAEVAATMRDTSLSHILAISGMHMAMITGLIFLIIRFALVAIPYTRHRRNNKKTAALIAMMCGFGYLLISGMPVSALRAFVMVALIFSAVLLDRRVMPMRSLALAAMLLLLWHPAYILEPGFQLSFMATAGLIAWYERLSMWTEGMEEKRTQRIIAWIIGILMTSLVAQAVTTPLVIYHFNHFPVYGLLANLLVMPLVNFAIMPLVVLSFMLMPFGLEGISLQPLGWSIRTMISIAQWVTTLPYDNLRMPSIPHYGMAVIFFGLCWLILWQTRIRFAGLGVIALGCMSMLFVRTPDIYIAQDAKQIALRNNTGHQMLKGTPRAFTSRLWAAAAAGDAFLPKDKGMPCDARGCVVAYEGSLVALPNYQMALPQDCANASLVITPGYIDIPCNTQTITRKQLKEQGHMWGWYDGESWEFQSTRDVQGDRRWSQLTHGSY